MTETMFICRECGARGDPPKCAHFQQAWSPDQMREAHAALNVAMNRVTWEDVWKQALQCPILSAMFEMQRQQAWTTPEEALLWAVLMLSEARIRALDEHAKTLAMVPTVVMREGFEIYQALEWQCRYVDPQTKLCCVRQKDHEGPHQLSGQGIRCT